MCTATCVMNTRYFGANTGVDPLCVTWLPGLHVACCSKHRPVQYIPRNMHTVFVLLCFVVVILWLASEYWLIYPYPSGLLHWHCGNLTIAPVPAKQPWWIWINTSCEFIMNDCIITTKQSTTKPCAYFLGYTVCRHGGHYCDYYHSTTSLIQVLAAEELAYVVFIYGCSDLLNELQRRDYMTGHQDSSTNHGQHVSCPIRLICLLYYSCNWISMA